MEREAARTSCTPTWTGKFVRVLVQSGLQRLQVHPSGGRISCTIERIPALCWSSVQDTGPGVPDADEAAIFDRFTQGEDGRRRRQRAGAQHRQGVRRTPPGHVVVVDARRRRLFQVELPPAPPTAPTCAPAATRRSLPAAAPAVRRLPSLSCFLPRGPAGAGGGGQPDLRLFLHDVLVDEYNVTLGRRRRRRIAAALADPPDLIVTDLMMPPRRRDLSAHPAQPAGFPQRAGAGALGPGRRSLLRERLLNTSLGLPHQTLSPQELRARVRNLVTVNAPWTSCRRNCNPGLGHLGADRRPRREPQIPQRSFTALQVPTGAGWGFTTTPRWASRSPTGTAASCPPTRHCNACSATGPTTSRGCRLSPSPKPPSAPPPARTCMDSWMANARLPHAKRYERRGGGYLWANVSASRIPAMAEDGRCWR